MEKPHPKTLPGYRILEQIHESVHSFAYRACREEDQAPVVIKILKEEYPPIAEVVRYRREFELGSRFNGCPGVARVLDLQELEHRLAIVLEDFGAQSLKKLMEQHSFSLTEGLAIGIEITRALSLLHGRGVIHKDLTPANVLLNRVSGEVKISDFGLSTQLSRENPGFMNPGLMEGTLAYISPEQTGRVSHPVDFRSDFYTLGATLYHLLTGRLPFDCEDTLELVHRHLADTPPAADSLDPRIPPVVSRILAKLMAKSPEDRYQSAVGIQADLERCLEGMGEIGRVEDFPIASRDFNPRLSVPEKLFGREAAVAQLLQCFDRVSLGQGELLLVSGYSGIGKTALVRTLFPPITTRAGFFVSGKFDQLQRNLPYQAFLDAFAQLLHYLLSEPSARLQGWKDRLLQALGPNVGVMIEMLPGLARILGPQPSAAALPPAESQNRFNFVLRQFIGVFGVVGHPLVLFVDDLQWADSASLNLLEQLATAEPRGHALNRLAAATGRPRPRANHRRTSRRRARDTSSGVILALARDPDVVPFLRVAIAPCPQ